MGYRVCIHYFFGVFLVESEIPSFASSLYLFLPPVDQTSARRLRSSLDAASRRIPDFLKYYFASSFPLKSHACIRVEYMDRVCSIIDQAYQELLELYEMERTRITS